MILASNHSHEFLDPGHGRRSELTPSQSFSRTVRDGPSFMDTKHDKVENGRTEKRLQYLSEPYIQKLSFKPK